MNNHSGGERFSNEISYEIENEINPTNLPILKPAELLGGAKGGKSQTESDVDTVDEVDDLDQVAVPEHSRKRQGKQWFQHVQVPDLVSPKSAFQGHLHALPVDQERVVLQDVLVIW